MIKGEYNYDVLHQEHQFVVYDHEKQLAFTINFDQHSVFEDKPLPVSRLKKNSQSIDILRALAECLKQMGLFPQDAVAAELKATKFHLEDMRTLALDRVANESNR